jgi:SAM-dependent methyltransferase
MKTIVSVQEISEFDIKPVAAVARWRALVEAEIARRWADRSSWIRVVWPTCKQEDAVPAFERFGVAYVECPTCGSLYAPFRPSEDELWAWYRESAPARFWREQLLPASEKARREKMTRPRADWVLDGIAEYVPSARRLVDISTYGRVLVDLVAAENPGLVEVMAAGMTADLEGGSTPRVRVQPTRVADLPGHGPADVVVAVDVLDRAVDLRALVEALRRLLAPGGVFFATTPVASGFEIQTLWERSPTIIPPDKLNLPTVEGLYRIFAAPAWELLELSTPGMFDVEMVRRAIEAEPKAPWPRVVRALVERSDASGRTALVELLQSRRLTSFARLVARRKN